MNRAMVRIVLMLILHSMFYRGTLSAQVTPYVGALAGVAALSADARSQLSPQGLAVSLYKPENGMALNFLAGVHLNDYLTVQGNYIWNENELTLGSTSSGSSSFYQQQRKSSQNAWIVDLLVYFRPRNSRLRPYLSAGTGAVHFSSTADHLIISHGLPTLPPSRFSSVRAALRVAVGMDIALVRRWAFRYSFSETVRHNDISQQLSPPGQRSLANFQNLFGFVVHF